MGTLPWRAFARGCRDPAEVRSGQSDASERPAHLRHSPTTVRCPGKRYLAAASLTAAMIVTPTAPGGDPRVAPELLFPSSLGEVVFPHEAHFNDMEIEFEACHHETNARMLDIPHVEYFADFWIDCATCHHPSSEPQRAMSCSACHHCPTHCADESLSSKVVIHASCWRCHEVGAGAAASAACATCHAGPQRAWGDGEGPSWIDGGS